MRHGRLSAASPRSLFRYGGPVTEEQVENTRRGEYLPHLAAFTPREVVFFSFITAHNTINYIYSDESKPHY